jgi:uridine kinase
MPADLIFIEGNFPFLYPEVAELIDLKVIYLTDDEIRIKRKWRRDIDYRKKYDLYYFLNRYFREQFLMAEAAYKPQMGMCDMLIDTTQAEVWLTPEVQLKLDLLVET